MRSVLTHGGFATVLIWIIGACGGPVLGNVPQPNTAAVAGGAAAAAAALTLADPDAASRKPEKKDPNENKQGTDVKQNVPTDVFDRLDHPAQPTTAQPALPAPKRTGPPPKLPSPKQAVEPEPDQDH